MKREIRRILYPTACLLALSSPAVIAQTVTFIVTKDGAGTGTITTSPYYLQCGSNCSVSTATSGSTVTLVATPEANSTFAGWSGHCSKDGTNTSASVTLLNSINTCTATFNLTSNAFTVNVAKSGTGTGSVTASTGLINCGTVCSDNYTSGSVVTFTATPAANSTFAGWGSNCTGSGTTTQLTIDSKKTCAATFNAAPAAFYRLTVSKDGTGGGTVTGTPGAINCGASCTADYTSGTSVSLTATPDANSTFTSWSGACSEFTGQTAKIAMLNPLTCTAKFTAKPSPPPPTLYPVSVSKSGDGKGTVVSIDNAINCGDQCSKEYAQNDIVTLTALPNNDSRFTGWSGDCHSSSTSATFIVTGSSSCGAKFESLAPDTTALTIAKMGTGKGQVSSSDGKINCGSTCTAEYTLGSTSSSSQMVSLTATPDVDSTFTGWNPDCGDAAATTNLTLGAQGKTCTATFEAIPPLPVLSIQKTGAGSGTVTSSEGLINCGSTCSNNYSAGNVVMLNATPDANSVFTGWSPDCGVGSVPTTTITMDQQDKMCSANFEPQPPCQPYQVWTYPQPLDFGTEMIGGTGKLDQWVSVYGQGCGQVKIDSIQFTGPQAAEFGTNSMECYYGGWQNYAYSSCRFGFRFTPTTEGTKEAMVNFLFDQPTVVAASPVAVTGKAVAVGQPKVEISPSSHDFGEVTAGALNYYQYQRFTVKNTGNVNANLTPLTLTGPNVADFQGHQWSWCSYKGLLKTGEECDVYMNFVPATVGDKQATLTINSEAPPATATLMGKASTPKNCEDGNITIESIGNGQWATATSGNYWDYQGDGDMWQRVNNSQGPNRPTEKDVVRIKAGHRVTAIPYATVRTLCIESGATLETGDQGGYYWGASLGITATDYLENKGSILGKKGADEAAGSTACSPQSWWQTLGNCAQPGANIYISAGLFLNEGSITAGAGGSGQQYGAWGGSVNVYGTGLKNTGSGLIRAGDGGDITSDAAPGQAGWGGFIGMWGQNYLQSDGSRGIFSGNGGDCNFAAGQIGGNGGGMRLNAQANVSLQGVFTLGKGGKNCATNGRDGGFNTDPNVLTLSGANTKVEGGDITIYGGDGWTMNLTDLSSTALTATGDITLAVGKGGAIDMRGSTGNILKASGTVYIFSDTLLLDETVKLSNLIEASNIVVGPAKILHDVELTTASSLLGEPQASVPITLTVANGSPAADTFTLNITDAAGWSLTEVPTTVTLEALDVVDLTFKVALPATRGAMDVIKITAVSQADSSVTASTQVQVAVSPEIIVPVITPPATGTGEVIPGGTTTPGTGTTTPDQGGATTTTTPSSGTTSVTPPTTGTTTAPTTTGISPSQPATTMVTSSVGTCPATGVIEGVCNNRGRVVTDATVTASAKLAGGQLAGNIANDGFIAGVTIQKGTTLTGGILTGYIINEGTIADFTFLGASVKGGILAGKIVNASKVGGILIDVTFAPNATLTGGKLRGRIQGDETAPALLENVKVLAGSHLSGVKLGDHVVLEKGVIVDELKTEETSTTEETPETPPTTTEVTAVKLDLPTLGKATVTDVNGKKLKTSTQLSGGVTVNDDETFATTETAKILTDTIVIYGGITPEANHVGKTADLLVYVAYRTAPKEPSVYLMLDTRHGLLPWDEKLANLVAFQANTTLTDWQPLKIYEGVLLGTGELDIFFGYRLTEDGTVVLNKQPIKMTITE